MSDIIVPPTASTLSSSVVFQYFGAATLLFSFEDSHVLTDGFFSRPGRLRVLFGKIQPQLETIKSCLSRANLSHMDAVLVGHSHYDHTLDAPVVAALTSAQLVGSPSTAQIGRGSGLPSRQITQIQPGISVPYGKFLVTYIPSRHSVPNLYPGEIATPFQSPAYTSAYREGGCYSILLQVATQNILIHGSAGFIPGALANTSAETIFLAIASLSRLSRRAVEEYFSATILVTRANRVFPIHWDDFQKKTQTGLKYPPAWLDDVSKTMRLLENFCALHQIDFIIPTYASAINLSP
jgi:L-ascorbate metabolism protein UlaG (beta-lactamase superfamily)